MKFPFLTEAIGEGINAPLSISGRDLILVLGGLFLLAKATFEIHHLMEEPDKKNERQRKIASVGNVLVQIAILDLVFSLDSVITAIGMADRDRGYDRGSCHRNYGHDRLCRSGE